MRTRDTQGDEQQHETPATSPAKSITFADTMLFYNPGPRFQDTLRYDSPFKLELDGKPAQIVQGMLAIVAEERAFFEVPAVVKMVNEETGADDSATLRGIYTRVMDQYRSRGVVLVEKTRHKSRVSDPNVASTREEAQAKGDDLHLDFIHETASEWVRIVDNVKSTGGVPTRASGVYKYALTKLHMADPADQIQVLQHERAGMATAKEAQEDTAALKLQLAKLEGMIAGLVAGKAVVETVTP